MISIHTTNPRFGVRDKGFAANEKFEMWQLGKRARSQKGRGRYVHMIRILPSTTTKPIPHPRVSLWCYTPRQNRRLCSAGCPRVDVTPATRRLRASIDGVCIPASSEFEIFKSQSCCMYDLSFVADGRRALENLGCPLTRFFSLSPKKSFMSMI